MTWLAWKRRALGSADIEAIAERTAHHFANLLERPTPSAHRLLEAKELASTLNVSVDFVYAHAAELGAMRLGDGPRARLRFDLRTAETAMKAHRRARSAIAARR
jgi:hypothetical protein